MKTKKNVLSKVVFDDLIERKMKNEWAGFQSHLRCKLGKSKTFVCEGEETRTLTARCSQHGGTWSGYYTYTIDEILN